MYLKELAILVNLASMMSTLTTMSIPALADKSSASQRLNIADQNIHNNLRLKSKQDLNFHIGTCNGGHSTAILDTIGVCSGLHTLVGAQIPSQFHSPKH